MGGGHSKQTCPGCPQCGKNHCAGKPVIIPALQSTSTHNCLMFRPTSFYGSSVANFPDCFDTCLNDKDCIMSAFTGPTPINFSILRKLQTKNVTNMTDTDWNKFSSNNKIDGTLIKNLEEPCGFAPYNYTNGEFS